MTYNNPSDTKRISFIVYLNGIEVPATSISVSMGVWAVPSATISFPADRTLKRIGFEDRMRATAFYLDSTLPAIEGGPPQFRLLFDGEIAAYSFTNTPQGRTLSVQCMGLPSALQQLKLYFLMNVANLVTRAVESTEEKTSIGAHYEHIFPASLFYSGLDPSQEQPINRPFDFIDNMFRALFGANDASPKLLEELTNQLGGDSVEPGDIKSAVGLHWFSRWSRRTRFHRQWIPMPGFEERYQGLPGQGVFPILESIQRDKAIDAVRHVAGRIGDNGSMWDMLRAIFGNMYYEVAMLSTPPCVDVERGTVEVAGPPTEKTKQTDGLYERRLLSCITKPQLLFAVPPACNILWKSLITSFQYSEDYRTQPTRLTISEGNFFNVITGGAPQGDLTELFNKRMSAAFPPDAQEQIDRRLGRYNDRMQIEFEPDGSINPHNYLVWPEEFFKGPMPVNRGIPPWFMYLSGAEGTENRNVEVQFGNIKEQTVAFLTSLEKDERPSTLTALKNLGISKTEVVNTRKAAEKIPTTVSASNPTSINLLVQWRNVLAFCQKSGMGSAADSLAQQLGTAEDDTTVANQPTYKLYAQYEYFRERYSRRTGAVTTVFNPYVVPGFPGVIWDSDQTQHHCFMYMLNVTHHLSINSASTQINYTFGRTFDEFFDELVRTRHEIERLNLTESDAANLQIAEEEGIDALGPVAQRGVAVDRAGLVDFFTSTSTSLGDILVDPEELTEDVDSVPANPVKDLRVVFQHNDPARASYEKLFWQNRSRPMGRDTIFDWSTMVQFLEVTTDTPTELVLSPDIDFLNMNVGFVPSEKFQVINNNPDEALKYVSRPICTLNEWIDFHQDKGTRQDYRHPDDPLEGKGAEYWVKILNLIEGPSTPPSKTPRGNRERPIEVDTRYPWEDLLRKFRRKVYQELPPQRA